MPSSEIVHLIDYIQGVAGQEILDRAGAEVSQGFIAGGTFGESE